MRKGLKVETGDAEGECIGGSGYGVRNLRNQLCIFAELAYAWMWMMLQGAGNKGIRTMRSLFLRGMQISAEAPDKDGNLCSMLFLPRHSSQHMLRSFSIKRTTFFLMFSYFLILYASFSN
jgi:hypothetical protein